MRLTARGAPFTLPAMPRQAILSDIHANQVALERALSDCREQRVDQIVCLGDMVGYGPDPVECVDLVREHCAWSLCGNHEVGLFLPVAVGFNRIAREALDLHRDLLKPRWYSLPETVRRWQWLRGLEPSRCAGEVVYVHGSPRDPVLEYVDEVDVVDLGFGPSQKIEEVFARIPRLCFCGHTHRPGVVTQDYHWLKPQQLEGLAYELPVGERTLINVGAVGQPRDRHTELCYVIYDSDRGHVQFRRLAYDVAAAQARFAARPRLHERCRLRLAEGT